MHGPSYTHPVFASLVRALRDSRPRRTLVAALALVRSGRWWTWLAGGLAAGVAIGCLHNGVFALPPLAVAALLDARRRGW